MKITPLFPILLVAALGLGACQITGDANGAVEASMAEGYYAEVAHDGRIYVFGTEASHATFQSDKKAVEFHVTKIGWGPNGETVKFETGGDEPTMTDRIVATFTARHGVN